MPDRLTQDPLDQEGLNALLRAAPWRRFAVIGDSIAEGLGEEAPGYGPEPWGERIASALAAGDPAAHYVNFGRRYLRAAEIRATQLAPALAFEPDLVAVVSGGNDVLDPAFARDALTDELEATVAPLAATGATVISFTLLDITRAIPMAPEFGEHVGSRLAMLADMWREIARRHDTVHVDLARHPASADPRIYSVDRMHVNTRGHAVVATATARALAEHMSTAAAPAAGSSMEAVR
jgi:lysophospholipase L1-like esterase